MSVSSNPPAGRLLGISPPGWSIIVIVIVLMIVSTTGVIGAAVPAMAAGIETATGLAAVLIALYGLRSSRAA